MCGKVPSCKSDHNFYKSRGMFIANSKEICYIYNVSIQHYSMCYFNILFFAVYIMQAQYSMEDIHLGLLDCQWNISCKLFSYSTDPPL